jgi:hypothetical protein
MSTALHLSSIEAICQVLLLLLGWQQWLRHKWNLLLLLLLWLLLLLLWWLLLLLLLLWRRRWLRCKVNMWLLLLLWCVWNLRLLLGLLEVLLEIGRTNHLMASVVASVAKYLPCLKHNVHNRQILVVVVTICLQPT